MLVGLLQGTRGDKMLTSSRSSEVDLDETQWEPVVPLQSA